METNYLKENSKPRVLKYNKIILKRKEKGKGIHRCLLIDKFQVKKCHFHLRYSFTTNIEIPSVKASLTKKKKGKKEKKNVTFPATRVQGSRHVKREKWFCECFNGGVSKYFRAVCPGRLYSYKQRGREGYVEAPLRGHIFSLLSLSLFFHPIEKQRRTTRSKNDARVGYALVCVNVGWKMCGVAGGKQEGWNCYSTWFPAKWRSSSLRDRMNWKIPFRKSITPRRQVDRLKKRRGGEKEKKRWNSLWKNLVKIDGIVRNEERVTFRLWNERNE